MGGDPAQISRYESGRIKPSAHAVVKLAPVCDVSTDHLVVEDRPQRPLRGAEDALGERLGTIGELSAEDLTLLFGSSPRRVGSQLGRLRGS